MINANRIVPVQKADLLSLYALILAQDTTNNADLAALEADELGVFSQSTDSAVVIANEPVTSFEFGSSVTDATVYFVAAVDYEGFTKTDNTLTVTEPTDGIECDGVTLYKAVLATNALTITQVSF